MSAFGRWQEIESEGCASAFGRWQEVESKGHVSAWGLWQDTESAGDMSAGRGLETESEVCVSEHKVLDGRH